MKHTAEWEFGEYRFLVSVEDSGANVADLLREVVDKATGDSVEPPRFFDREIRQAVVNGERHSLLRVNVGADGMCMCDC